MLGVLAGVALISDSARIAPLLLLLGVATMLGAIARWAQRSRVGGLVHDFLSPYFAVGCAFELSGVVIDRATRGRWDAVLASMDARTFDGLALAWRDALGRPSWLTDLASIAYVSFYALPMVLGVALYRRRERRDFDDFVLAIEASFFLSYVGYLAFPARGPRLPIDLEASLLGGGAISAAVRSFVQVLEVNDVDAFPSGHTLVSLVLLTFGWRHFPRWRAPLGAVVALIVFSTVYLSFHYVVDVVAGACAAGGLVLLHGAVARRVEGKRVSARGRVPCESAPAHGARATAR